MKNLKSLFEEAMCPYKVGDIVNAKGKKGTIKKIAGKTVHISHEGEISRPYKMSEIGEIRK